MRQGFVGAGLLLVGIALGAGARPDGTGSGCVPGDVNGDAQVDVSDPVHLLRHLFLGGGPPVGCPPAAELPAVAVIVRHAEKETGTDPGLTPEGEARAQRLAWILSDAALDHVIASDLVRTRETLEPLAARRGMALETALDAPEVVARLRGLEPGRTAVVCHHSYTIPTILRDLGVEGWREIPVDGDHYDEFLVVLLAKDGRTGLLRLKY